MNAPEFSRTGGKLTAKHWLSMGDHYHKIELCGDSIEVKKYRPTKDSVKEQKLSFHYRYNIRQYDCNLESFGTISEGFSCFIT